MKWDDAPDVKARIEEIVKTLDMEYIDTERIICFRSTGSTARARARIWNFHRVWQKALDLPPHYVIEVISHYFDDQSYEQQTKILIHELLHIPKNFSGSLMPHKTRYSRIDDRTVNAIYKEYKKRQP